MRRLKDWTTKISILAIDGEKYLGRVVKYSRNNEELRMGGRYHFITSMGENFYIAARGKHRVRADGKDKLAISIKDLMALNQYF